MQFDALTQRALTALNREIKPQDIADQLQKSGQINQVVSEIRQTLPAVDAVPSGRGRSANDTPGLPPAS